MSENSHIDKFFKEGIGEMNFSGADAAWQKMEAELDSGKNKKRRFAFIIASSAVLLLAGGFFAVKNTGTPGTTITEDKLALAKNQENRQVNSAEESNTAASKNNTTVLNTSIPAVNTLSKKINSVPSGTQKNILHRDVQAVAPGITTVPAPGEIETDDESITEDNFLKQPLLTGAELLTPVYNKQATVLKFTPPVTIKTNKLLAKKEPVKQNNRYSIDLIGGTDVLRMNRKAGYYAGVRLSRKIDQGVAVSVGLTYTNHTVKDNYRRTTKPLEERRADFKLMDMSMIRMPVYLHQQMGKSKFSLMAGLVPSYVINADIYNVPNSFNGDPNEYNKFSIKDINRFNVLFGAGIKYSPVKRVAIEVSGSYGFTGLVKDGYRNQSRTLDNFKSIQAGLVLNLK